MVLSRQSTYLQLSLSATRCGFGRFPAPFYDTRCGSQPHALDEPQSLGEFKEAQLRLYVAESFPFSFLEARMSQEGFTELHHMNESISRNQENVR
jgi:hypothetical protein